MKQQQINSKELYKFCCKVLQNVGVEEEQAKVMSNALVEADLLGVATHGVSRINYYIDHIENNTIKAVPQFEFITDFLSVSVIDGDQGMGPVIADFAMENSIKKARETGLGLTAVRNSTHMGALSVVSKKATENKMIGIVISNTSPIMAPWGGAEATLGNNPISIAIPSDGDFPYVLDMALSIVARGNIILAAREGKEIPAHWAVDHEGNPTTDAEQALLGAIQPLAQHKGYALAFMFDILAAVLSGASYGKNAGKFVPPDYSKPLDFGHFILAINIEKISEYDEFLMRLKDYVQQVKNSEKAKGFEEILVPGERASKKYKDNLDNGIKLTIATREVLIQLGEKYNVDTNIF